jgi:hypothetical protein
VTEANWYYAKDGQRQGPVSLAELKEMVTTGALHGEDLIWNASMSSWMPICSESSLAPLVASTPSGPLGPPPLAAQEQDWIRKSKSLAAGVVRLIQNRRSFRLARSHPLPAAVTHFIQKLVWSICAVVVVLGGLLFLGSLGQAETAIQQASAGAMFSTIFIGVYILARCIEKFVKT